MSDQKKEAGAAPDPKAGDVDYKARYEALATATKEFKFKADKEEHAVPIFNFGEDGSFKPSEEAQKLLSGGKHLHKRLAGLNEEVESKVQVRLAEAGGGKGKDGDGKPAKPSAAFKTAKQILAEDKALAERIKDGDGEAIVELNDRVAAQFDGIVNARVEAAVKEATKGIKPTSPDDVELIIRTRELKRDPRFRAVADALGMGDEAAGADAIFRTVNRLMKGATDEHPFDIFKDVLDPYIAKYSLKVENHAKPDADKTKDGVGDGKDRPAGELEPEDGLTPPPSGANGAGAGGGGRPRNEEIPDFGNDPRKAQEWLEKERAKRLGGFDQAKYTR